MDPPPKWSFFLLLFLLAAVNADPVHIIKDGQLLLSDNKNFALGFFGFGNSTTRRYVGIWYYKIPHELTVVWVANRNHPLNDTSGNFVVDSYGNLVIYSLMQNISLWSMNVSTSTTNDVSVKLLNTGNLVVVQRESQRILWQSFDYPSHTLLPYMKIGLDRRTGFSWFLTSWKAPDDPGDGNFTCRIDPTGYPQFILYDGSIPRWRAGSWTGRRWTGVPEMTRSFIINTSYVDNADEVSISNGITVDTVLMRMTLDESGSVHRSAWHGQDRKWNEFWSAPTEWCDSYNRCGQNSNCDPYNADRYQCTCLPGFEPKSPRDWFLREPSGGCVRKRENATCRNGEGFVKVARVKLPDTSKARGDKSMDLYTCGQACLKDCNCTAYTSANETSGMGCITWYGALLDTRTYASVGQDLYVRVDAIELAEYAKNSNHHSTKKKVVATVIVSVVAILLLVAFLVYIREKTRRRNDVSKSLSYFGDSTNSKELDESRTSSDLPVFDLNTIAKATDNFSFDNKLGEGGFGSVYKGKLKSGEEIAVKRLAKNSGQGAGEFKNEVKLIAKLQHRNLVRILGYCVQHEEKMLVYEYLPNKSLDSFIFGVEGKIHIKFSTEFSSSPQHSYSAHLFGTAAQLISSADLLSSSPRQICSAHLLGRAAQLISSAELLSSAPRQSCSTHLLGRSAQLISSADLLSSSPRQSCSAHLLGRAAQLISSAQLHSSSPRYSCTAHLLGSCSAHLLSMVAHLSSPSIARDPRQSRRWAP